MRESNPYTSKFPTGELNRVEFQSPRNVVIAWPNVSGGTEGTNIPNAVQTDANRQNFFGRITHALFG